MPFFRRPAPPPTLLEQIATIPRTLLPDGVAREQLVQEAQAGGPLIEVYTKGPLTEDFTGGGPLSFIIERPLPGRSDSRWSPVEWRQWVEAGMPTTSCDFCGHPPASLTVAAVILPTGRPATLCCSCHAAVLGLYGMSRAPVITCVQCGRLDIQITPDRVICRTCFFGGSAAP
ncbi:MAG: hypothetical protein H0X24_14565 [Ktedonobacterales bacterium]|nr:hypothetical protein [Ktedonobacterales bacterium]